MRITQYQPAGVTCFEGLVSHGGRLCRCCIPRVGVVGLGFRVWSWTSCRLVPLKAGFWGTALARGRVYIPLIRHYTTTADIICLRWALISSSKHTMQMGNQYRKAQLKVCWGLVFPITNPHFPGGRSWEDFEGCRFQNTWEDVPLTLALRVLY